MSSKYNNINFLTQTNPGDGEIANNYNLGNSNQDFVYGQENLTPTRINLSDPGLNSNIIRVNSNDAHSPNNASSSDTYSPNNNPSIGTYKNTLIPYAIPPSSNYENKQDNSPQYTPSELKYNNVKKYGIEYIQPVSNENNPSQYIPSVSNANNSYQYVPAVSNSNKSYPYIPPVRNPDIPPVSNLNTSYPYIPQVSNSNTASPYIPPVSNLNRYGIASISLPKILNNSAVLLPNLKSNMPKSDGVDSIHFDTLINYRGGPLPILNKLPQYAGTRNFTPYANRNAYVKPMPGQYIISMDQIEYLPASWVEDNPILKDDGIKVFRVGTIGDGSCFVHSMLYILNPSISDFKNRRGKKYINYSARSRKEFGKIVRKWMSDQLVTPKEIFSNMSWYDFYGGGIYKQYAETLSNIDSGDVGDQDYTIEGIKKYLNSCEDFDDRIIGLASAMLNVNIIITQMENGELVGTKSYYTSDSTNGVIISDKTITVLYIGGGNYGHYEAIGIQDKNGDQYFIFDNDDPFIIGLKGTLTRTADRNKRSSNDKTSPIPSSLNESYI